MAKCQTENLTIEKQEDLQFKTRNITGAEALKIANQLKQILPQQNIDPKAINQNQELSTTYGTLDYSKIAVIEKENGDTKYAIRIVDTDIADNKFKNLILKEVGTYTTVTVAEYEMDSSFANDYYANLKDISEFEGSIKQTIVTTNAPCTPDDTTTPIGGSGGSGGGGTGGGTTGGNTGGGVSSGSSSSGGGATMIINCNNCGRSYGSTAGWRSSICATYDVTIIISFGTPSYIAAPNPCDDDRELPLITLTDDDIMLRNFFKNNLTQTQRLFLISSNPSISNDINNYLIQNSNNGVINPSAVAFVSDVIDEMKNDPTFTSIKPFLIEKKIDDTQLSVCDKDVLTSVKNTTVCDIAQVLAKFDANATVYNTTMKSQVPPSGAPAQTIRDSRNNYSIYLNPNLSNATKLYRAATIMHEMIHSYFMSIKDDYGTGTPPNPAVFNDFPTLFDAFVLKKYPSGSAAAHHDEMANSYVDALARALQEYQTGVPVPAGTSPDQIFSDLAWGGLKEAPIFDIRFPVGSPERDRVINRYNCEGTGNPVGQGTPQQQNPIGGPC